MSEQSHASDPFALCPACKERVPFQEIQLHHESCVKEAHRLELQHYSYPSLQPQVCPTCGKSLSSKHNLDMHQKIHLRAQGLLIEERKHYCDKCGKNFTTKMALNRHLNNVHVSATCQVC